MMHRLKLHAAAFCAVLLCAALLTGCGADAVSGRAVPGGVSFTPTVFLSADGMIRLLYDSDADMLSTLEGYRMVSLYDGGNYSLLVSYQEGTVRRSDADEAVRAEFSAGDGILLSRGTKRTTVSGHTFRRAEITGSDGSSGAVCYGNTETGFAELYYLISPDAPEGTREHAEEILSTVVFGEFTGAETEDVIIYAD